jgi:hypothetical protein
LHAKETERATTGFVDVRSWSVLTGFAPRKGTTMRYVDQEFEGSRVVIDGNDYERCRFRRCTIVFTGWDGVSLDDCDFTDCTWVFEDAAATTIDFLRALEQGAANADNNLFDLVVAAIKDGTITSAVNEPAAQRLGAGVA